MTQQAFFFDGTRCTGCKTCVFACKDKNNLDVGMKYRTVTEYTGGDTTVDANGCYASTCFSYYLSVSCNHCDEPLCLGKCPQGAITKDEETGFVSSDPEKCIGCGTCVKACPYGAPSIDTETKKSVKCDACADLVAAGEKPACVMACPARALDFGTVDEMMAKGGERANIAPLPAATETTPNLFIVACQDAKPVDSADGAIGNPLEVELD